MALDYSKKYGFDTVRVLKLHHNRGKGGAVRLVCHVQTAMHGHLSNYHGRSQTMH